MTYEDFCTPDEVATYKRVKRRAMRLAEAARQIAAEMVDGSLETEHGKHFLRTDQGLFRLSMGANSDNTTEAAAHVRMGAVHVVMGDEFEMQVFFERHGWGPGAYDVFVDRLRAELDVPEPEQLSLTASGK